MGLDISWKHQNHIHDCGGKLCVVYNVQHNLCFMDTQPMLSMQSHACVRCVTNKVSRQAGHRCNYNTVTSTHFIKEHVFNAQHNVEP